MFVLQFAILLHEKHKKARAPDVYISAASWVKLKPVLRLWSGLSSACVVFVFRFGKITNI